MSISSEGQSPTVKEVLILLGVGALVVASVAMPGLPMAAGSIVKIYKKRERDKREREWNRFNQFKLHQVLRRLYSQKTIEISEGNNQVCIKLTQKGHSRLLKYNLEEIMIEHPPRWDGKWRVIIYDIAKEKRVLSEIFRQFLTKMMFLKLQKSVYLTPYPCDKQIEFLRQYYGLDKEVLYLVVNKIENEEAYKKYFGL
ncbi:hypothetical protein A3A14_00270 [Candidatus Daviesbacteria bacterium RIFCSPLOWO2_01_FULL_43_38]|uniref:Transcriptional repressor PaaX-like central Cas2-like domain-containing protein n=1 Tax=Candidatus Daviesbacteria bacterium RIFCSPHIGHO2_12_FULL_43_11 TaxID=1797780 RepID=A0A1F5K4E1_9BACT|nr:MAG: hypothetical protein A2874_00910 [Candidatus Daviesbacteria bacterium RIFCSPHIGHO2_01_FULL_43_17]OGE35777.1 MAG: hypothetical protein A3E45_00595 [Candidatus Daviesbacteria bacterium RIFCSPHIGHO2_12_FULL_43_11]OGE63462.1 MAG: hypothetical protein A3A14_00270 [Candidatus Daviesbacteria bacterium RIFCSPLOWO2_01_FULL_43_38]OGE69688.1 MAG: hypothetical protein A3J21_03300 [Candidatus Daviesbacteria bacterium RIFCSPLOWO2_02_FULL_43_11]